LGSIKDTTEFNKVLSLDCMVPTDIRGLAEGSGDQPTALTIAVDNAWAAVALELVDSVSIHGAAVLAT